MEITTNQFGVITAAFTLGGLVSSFQSGRLADGVGRKLAAVYSSVLIVAGGVSMSMASSMWVLVLGRFLVGLGAIFETWFRAIRRVADQSRSLKLAVSPQF